MVESKSDEDVMQARVTKNDEQQPILLCCAGPDRAVIAPVVERASHLGRAWLVCGVEVNTKRLERGIERYGVSALYVLCRSRHLHTEKVEALQQLLQARGVPPRRIMVVEARPGDGQRVEGALEQRMAASRAPASQKPAAIPPPPKVARAAAREKTPPAKPAPAMGSATRSPRPLARVTLVPKAPKSATPKPASKPVTAKARTLVTRDLVRRRPPSSPAPVPKTVPTPEPEPVEATPRQNTDSVPVAPDMPEPEPARSMSARLPRPRLPRWLMAGAAAAMVLGLGGASLAIAGGDEPAGSPADDVVAQETVEPAPAAAAAVDEPTVAAAEAPEPIAPEPEPELEPEPEARAPIDVPTPSDEASSYALEIQGLRSRELREVDGIVFTANVLDRDIHYLRAEAYCRNLELSGIGDWRLPTAAELGTISSVVDLGRAPLWTATEGDAKAQSMLVYRDRADEFAVHGRTWRGARALCVRSSSDA